MYSPTWGLASKDNKLGFKKKKTKKKKIIRYLIIFQSRNLGVQLTFTIDVDFWATNKIASVNCNCMVKIRIKFIGTVKVNDSGVIHGATDADYETRIATHNQILVHESNPEHDYEAIISWFPTISRGIIWLLILRLWRQKSSQNRNMNHVCNRAQTRRP